MTRTPPRDSPVNRSTKSAKPKAAKRNAATPKTAKAKHKIAKPKIAKIDPADGIARAEPSAIARLAAADRETWRAWLTLARYNSTPLPCTPELLRALLDVDDLKGWLSRVFKAYQGLNPDDGLDAHYTFQEWFSAGMQQHLPPTHPSVLTLAYRRALDDIAEGAAQRAAALAKSIEDAGQTNEHRALLGRALLLLARRLGEEGDLDGASVAASRAEAIFAQLDDAAARAFAVRVRASALLVLRKVDEALALLETVRAHSSPIFARDGMFRPIVSSENTARVASALGFASERALWSSNSGHDWVHAVSALALDRANARHENDDDDDDDDDDEDTFERGPFV